MKKIKITLLLLLSSLILSPSAFPQGPLLPPAGPIGPTMKSLDQIDTHVAQAGEKRIPIDAAHTPGDANYEFIVTVAASYYLTRNIGVAKTNGIKLPPGATLDLNGFAVTRTAGSGGIGIEASSNCVIKHGTISGFEFGVDGFFGVAGRLEGIVVNQCKRDGLRVGDRWEVSSCSANDNLEHGIQTQSGCVLVKDTASNNNLGGIQAGPKNIVSDCTSSQNLGFGFSLRAESILTNAIANNNAQGGIVTETSCFLAGCKAASNTGFGFQVDDGSSLSNCTATLNSADGIQVKGAGVVTACQSRSNGNGSSNSGIVVGSGSIISGCSAFANLGDGIQFASSCLVTGNNSSSNGKSTIPATVGHGFHSTGTLNRVDSNTATNNSGNGFFFPSGSDYVTRNTANSNKGAGGNKDYNPATAGNMGPIGSLSAATSPWANFR